VLVAGGFGGNTNPSLASAEVYDAATGSWTPTGSLRTGRQAHTLTLLPLGSVLTAGGSSCATACGDQVSTAELYTPPSSVRLPPSCSLAGTGTDTAGRAFMNVAARDIASGLQSVRVVQATNSTVALPKFPPGFREPAVVTATKIDPAQPSVLKLAVTNRTGTTLTCDPVLTTLVGQAHGASVQVFRRIPQAESKVILHNGQPGLERVDLYVNGHRFRLANLADGEGQP
jgi:hypothetical protein